MASFPFGSCRTRRWRGIRVVASLCAAVCALLFCAPVSAGHYRLVYWRETGFYENAGCQGHHVINVRVWDRSGTRIENVDVYTTWGVKQATINYEGQAQFVIDEFADRDVTIVDPPHTSDASPLFSVRHGSCFGHYTYEVGFMRVDRATDLAIDTTTCGTLNGAGSNDNDAPHTESLIFHSLNCLDRMTDPFALGTWSNSLAQTFVVPEGVNRILGTQFHITIGPVKVDYWVEIRRGGPTGPVVFSKQTQFPVNDGPWLMYFGLDDCPVEPGETYAVRMWRSGGSNAYHVTQNVYPLGSAYANDVANPGLELRGFVVGGTRQGLATPTPTPSPTPAHRAILSVW